MPSLDTRRARLILLLEAGDTWATIRGKLDCNDAFIDRWSKRFREERLAGLFSRHAGQEASTLTPQLEARILEWTVKRKPTDGSTHWSTRKLAAQRLIVGAELFRRWLAPLLPPCFPAHQEVQELLLAAHVTPARIRG